MNSSVPADGRHLRSRTWLGPWTLATAPAALLAFMALPAPVVIVVAVLAFVGALARLAACDDEQRRCDGARVHSSWTLRVAARLAVLAVGLVGTMSYSVWLGLASTAAFALHGYVATRPGAEDSSGPPRIPQQRTAPRSRPAPPEGAVVNHLAILSDGELCREWRQSFVVLQHAAGAGRRAWVVDMRQSLLEEMERRNPEGLEAWLRSGDGASGGPERYFH